MKVRVEDHKKGWYFTCEIDDEHFEGLSKILHELELYHIAQIGKPTSC